MPKVNLNLIDTISCKTTGKVCYSNIQDARVNARNLSNSSKLKYSAYYCEDCGYYHIGHYAKKDSREDEDWWETYKYNN